MFFISQVLRFFFQHNCWQEVIDELQGYTYYWNPETNETSWTAPADATIVKAPISNTPSNNLATEADPANDSQVISEVCSLYLRAKIALFALSLSIIHNSFVMKTMLISDHLCIISV